MGVEPTAARSARPATDFEDRGTHRGTTTPLSIILINDRTEASVAENNEFATELDRPVNIG
jgi:hypothetical protein